MIKIRQLLTNSLNGALISPKCVQTKHILCYGKPSLTILWNLLRFIKFLTCDNGKQKGSNNSVGISKLKVTVFDLKTLVTLAVKINVVIESANVYYSSCVCRRLGPLCSPDLSSATFLRVIRGHRAISDKQSDSPFNRPLWPINCRLIDLTVY